MSDVLEFGFDDGKVIKDSSVEEFKLEKGGKARISLVAFKKLSDGVILKKVKERFENFSEEEKAKRPLSLSLLSDQEKLDVIAAVDKRIAEKLGKKPEEVKEIDRLDITKPKFWMGFTHYRDGVGTIRCMGTYKGTTLIEPGKCCEKIGDAEQRAVTIVLQYPIGEHMQPNLEMMKQRLYTNVLLYKMSAKQYKRLESTFVEAQSDGKPTMDLKTSIDGDPKFKKHLYETASCFWAREDFDPEVRAWILDQALRAAKHCPNNLGMEMTPQKFLEKLGESPAAMASGASEDRPKVQGSYVGLLD